MIVLSYGMTKSGSTLAFELCKSVLQQRGFEQRRLPNGVVAQGHHINFINDVSIPVLRQAMEEVSSTEIIAIKVHAAVHLPAIPFVETAISQGQLKVHVNLRDPREICLSLVDAGVKAREKNRTAFAEIRSLDDAAEVASRQLLVCRRWGSITGALHLFYNEVAFDTSLAVRQMCADFDFPMFNDEELKVVLDRVFNDAFTQRNKAVKDRYKDELTLRQNEFLLEELKGAQAFIRRVCEQRDFSWFRQPRGAKEEATSAE
jgi:hypothetical protein